MREISLREMSRRDYPQLEAMIKQTWHFEKHCGNEASAKRMARLYLCDSIAERNKVIVAEEDGKIIGAIMMRCDKESAKPRLLHRTAQILATANVMRAKAGRKGRKLYKNVCHVDHSLLEGTGQSFGGELTFFAVADGAQGRGVGKKLLAEAKAYFRSKECENFCVFTDTACNYGFYDSQGFRKIGEQELKSDNKRKSNFKYFIYEYTF